MVVGEGFGVEGDFFQDWGELSLFEVIKEDSRLEGIVIIAVRKGSRVRRQELSKSAGMGSMALDLMEALAISS